MLDVALGYAELGLTLLPLWPVLNDGRCACELVFKDPCARSGKHPATRWKKGGIDEVASRDPVILRSWWGPGHTRFGIPRSSYGVAVVTGIPSGLFVIDLDNKPEQGRDGVGAFRRLEAVHGSLAAGPVVRTPTGGLHLYAAPPAGGGKASVDVIAPGIDTRGENSFVVLPPSFHKSGRRYSWERELRSFVPRDLPTVPHWLLDMLARGRPPADGLSPVRRSTWNGPTVPRADAAATVVEVLDSSYARWMAEEPDDVRREPWRAFATNLHAACAGHTDLQEAARRAFHAISSGASSYRFRETEKLWRDGANSPPLSFSHAIDNGAPQEVCDPNEKNLVIAARRQSRSARRAEATIEAALHFLEERPGELTLEAIAHGLTVRQFLVDQGYLEDTSGYVPAALRSSGR